MKKASKIVVLFVFLFLAGWAGGLITSLAQPNSGALAIKNSSTSVVRSIRIDICEQNFELAPMKPKEFTGIQYEVTLDSHYSILVTYDSGKIVNKKLGYVTHGFDFFDLLVITDDDIDIIRLTPRN